MLKMLVWKESREIAPFFLGGLALNMWLVLMSMGFLFTNSSRDWIPFVQSMTLSSTPSMAWFVGLLIGMRVSYGETFGGTYLFLLHRPIARSGIVAVKLGVIIIAGSLIGLVPALFYALWAATPGSHPSPFYWSMTIPYWLPSLTGAAGAMGGFLAGLMPNQAQALLCVLSTIAIGIWLASWKPFGVIGEMIFICLFVTFFITASFRVVTDRDY